MASTARTAFTLLGGEEPLDDERLRALYDPPRERPSVRANVIASIDGAATVGGTSGGLGGAGDRQLFGVLRELADVVVVGAGTAREENYSGARMAEEQRRRRTARGQHPVPALALVTRGAAIDPGAPVFTDTEVPPLVLTCARAAGDARRRLGTLAEVVDCSGADPGRVDLALALARLADRGLTRILTEGGPSLLGALIERDLLDELCLTLAPVLVGGDAMRVVAGTGEALTRMRRAHAISDADGYLYQRFTRPL